MVELCKETEHDWTHVLNNGLVCHQCRICGLGLAPLQNIDPKKNFRRPDEVNKGE